MTLREVISRCELELAHVLANQPRYATVRHDDLAALIEAAKQQDKDDDTVEIVTLTEQRS